MQRLALASVYDKRRIELIGRILSNAGYTIVATTGTATALAAAGISTIPVSVTGDIPEAFDTCVKSISFKIVAGILYDRSNAAEAQTAFDLGIAAIDIVICNFQTLPDAFDDSAMREYRSAEIDVGGPLLVRAAAANYRYVLVVIDPDDYEDVGRNIVAQADSLEFRRRLAAKAFAYTCAFDQQIAFRVGRHDRPAS